MAERPQRANPPPDGRPVVPIENEVVEHLLGLGWTVAVAESLTGGAITHRLCSSPGVGDSVLGGMVTYATPVKRRLLEVEGPVVSGEAAIQMARAVRELTGADAGLSATGVAGPERQEGRPVGTVFVGWSTPDGEGCRHLACAGTPEQIQREATQQALLCLRRALAGD